MKTFEELGVSPEILKAIKEMGYENPMPVQEEVIPYLLGNGNDVVALAQTGTGKQPHLVCRLSKSWRKAPCTSSTNFMPHTRIVLADCRRSERLLQVHWRAENPSRIWWFIHRKPNTHVENRRTYYCGYSRTTDWSNRKKGCQTRNDYRCSNGRSRWNAEYGIYW